jgi:hypothetical protein
MVWREDDRPETIGSRGLGDAEFGTQRSAHARIVAGPEGDAWRMCAMHRTPNDRAERHLVPRSRKQRFTMGFTGLRWCAWMPVDPLPTAIRAWVALNAVAIG